MANPKSINIAFGLAIIVVADDDEIMEGVKPNEGVLDHSFLFVRRSLWDMLEPDLKKHIGKIVPKGGL